MVSFAMLLALSVFAGAVQAETNCSDVHVVWARGTLEPAGLGKEGTAFFGNFTIDLSDKTTSVYAVDYAAAIIQTSAGKGATDMTRHIVSYAATCPKSMFVIGGYSQGATVTDIAIGIDTVLGKGEVIPTTLAPRIKAVVTFGNPIKIFGQTIAKDSALYGAKSIDYCNKGDPVCANGFNVTAHNAYVATAVREASTRAAVLVKAGRRNLRDE
jgi:cutinase